MFEYWTLIVSIIILIFASGFFSSSETGLTAASDAKMRQLANNGNRNASLVEKLKNDKDSLISAILIGNNAVNVLASALATSAAIAFFDDSGVFIATLVMTILITIFAEVLPKTYAIKNANQFALVVATPIRFIVLILTPLTMTMRWISLIFLGRNSEISEDREEELRGLIDLQMGESTSELKETKAMLSSVLDLSELTVDEIMTHRGSVSMVNVEDKPEDIVSFVLNSPHTRLPVYSGKPENIIGVLHVKDLLRALQNSNNKNKKKFDVAKIASPTYFVPETTLLANQLQAFRTRREHFAIVVDEYGDFRGIVTLEDIIEEIVGDIDDEQDVLKISKKLRGIKPLSSSSFLVKGDVNIRDLNKELNINLPISNNISTVAGLVLYESRTIPKTKQVFSFFDLKFEILAKSNNQLTLIKITKKKI